MPVLKKQQVVFNPIAMDGVKGAAKAVVVGKNEGWPDYTMRVFRLEPSGYTPHHQHDWEHVNYIVKGKGQLTIDGKKTDVAEGDYAYVPPNTKHQFQNPYDADFEFICIVPNRGEY